MPRAVNTVYVIDPDESVHDALKTLLSSNGSKVVCYPNAEAFFGSDPAFETTCGCILLEANLPGMGSLAFLRRLQCHEINLPVVVLTSTSNRDIADQVLRAGAVEVIEKPLVSDRLFELLRSMVTDTSEFTTTP